MASTKTPEATAISRREHARHRLSRYVTFLKEATTGLAALRATKRGHHEALLTQVKLRNAAQEEAVELQAQGRPSAVVNARAARAQERIEDLQQLIAADNAKIVALRTRAKRGLSKKRHFLKRARFFAVKARHLKALREQREKLQPTFESWMANGADWEQASEGCRAYIARAVVLHGLTCTSMARTYVPAGGSTTSYHLVWNGGRAGDAAGSMDRMEACQRAEYQRGLNLPGQLEMFGPINDHCLKLGNPLTLTEGEPLETLHDTHVHCAEEDTAVDAAALNRK